MLYRKYGLNGLKDNDKRSKESYLISLGNNDNMTGPRPIGT